MLGRVAQQQKQVNSDMKTALIVIDMQNSFLHPDGEHYYADATCIVPNCRSLIDKARLCDTLVVHVADRHRQGFVDFENKRLPAHCVSDSFDAAYFSGFGPSGHTMEIEIVKRRFSAFFATELSVFLREQSVEQVILCGIKTNVCVRATAQDAFAHGFEVGVVRDATNSNRPHLAEASLEDIERYFGRLMSTALAIEALA